MVISGRRSTPKVAGSLSSKALGQVPDQVRLQPSPWLKWTAAATASDSVIVNFQNRFEIQRRPTDPSLVHRSLSSASHCQVTAIAVQSQSCSPGDPLLYAGTAWGVVVVARARGLRPITAFRPFEQEVRVICPFTNRSMLATLGTGY
ncbi:leucine-rich repeat serine/threonine-protein kinase 1-like, partial [Tropilaelaps mercedesae]